MKKYEYNYEDLCLQDSLRDSAKDVLWLFVEVYFFLNTIIVFLLGLFKNLPSEIFNIIQLLIYILGILFFTYISDKNILKKEYYKARNAFDFKKMSFVLVGYVMIEAITLLFVRPFMQMYNVGFAIENEMIMFIYLLLIAPILEELIFRGVILNKLSPFGKVFAIFTTSLLFGLVHFNLVQLIRGFMLGCLLAYLALEFSLKWSIFFHIFVNGMSLLLSFLVKNVEMNLILMGSGACLVLSLVYFYFNKDRISAYIKMHRSQENTYRYYFKSGWNIALMFFLVVSVILVNFVV